MIDVQEMEQFEPLYQFVANDGENINIASRRLRAWANEASARGEIETFVAPCEDTMAEKFIRERSVDPRHVAELLLRDPRTLWPVLFGIERAGEWLTTRDGAQGFGDVITIDGHHTYVAHCIARCPFVRAHFLRREEWERFRVTGVPSTTAEELHASAPRSAVIVPRRTENV